MYEPRRKRLFTCNEAVIEKDLTSEILAHYVEADLLVLTADVDGIYLNWGKPEQQGIKWITPLELKALESPAGLMGLKVGAAVQFVEKSENRAAIGALKDIGKIVTGEAGTNVVPG